MLYRFTTKYGRDLEIDLSKWRIVEDRRTCNVLGTFENDLVLENVQGYRFSVPESIIKVNGIKVEGNRVELSLGLYKKYLLDNLRIESKRKLDETFTEFAPLIFQRRDPVLSKAEYYLLKPNLLSASLGYAGSTHFTLGSLCESIESGNHVYFEEFCGYEGMFLLAMVASPLSGIVYEAIFWSDVTNEIVRFDSKSNLSADFGTKSCFDLIGQVKQEEILIDRQDDAIEKLIMEIKAAGN